MQRLLVSLPGVATHGVVGDGIRRAVHGVGHGEQHNGLLDDIIGINGTKESDPLALRLGVLRNRNSVATARDGEGGLMLLAGPKADVGRSVGIVVQDADGLDEARGGVSEVLSQVLRVDEELVTANHFTDFDGDIDGGPKGGDDCHGHDEYRWGNYMDDRVFGSGELDSRLSGGFAGLVVGS